MTDAVVAAVVFLVTYALIATDRIDKTVAALGGGLLMVVLGVVPQEAAFEAIDLNVIFLLAGMMALAHVLGRTGFFALVGIRAAKLADGRPYLLMVLLATITAVLSAFLDNVTTVVLLAPVTLYVATVLRVSPIPYLMALIFASNVGGTATLVGDPPNILIGSASGLDFVAFLVNLAPVAIVCFGALLVLLRLLFHGRMDVDPRVREDLMALDEAEVITDPRTMRLALVVIGGTILGFLVHRQLGLEAATVALLGATVLLLVGRIEVAPVLREIEWPTLFFFVGLFILVEGIVETGWIDAAANALLEATGGDPTVTVLAILWFSGIASAIVDNIPYTAAMIPLVEGLGAQGIPLEPAWWALALGADLGGNGTIVGASANVVVANIAAKAGHPMTFRSFLASGVVVVVTTLLISTVYLWVRYL
ncbi:MAG TPA: ArsB/NhaD family transporter [Candidatus Limnocylindrales bacterium]|nr:ArsB/NhaD family transporter [Candidatus Limnocylindrales bacterium]